MEYNYTSKSSLKLIGHFLTVLDPLATFQFVNATLLFVGKDATSNEVTWDKNPNMRLIHPNSTERGGTCSTSSHVPPGGALPGGDRGGGVGRRVPLVTTRV